MSAWMEAFRDSVEQLPGTVLFMALAAMAFFALAVFVKGLAGALAGARKASGEVRINAVLWAIDQVTVTPTLNVIAAASGLALHAAVVSAGLRLDPSRLWAALGGAPTLLAVVFIGDFLGYWRHRVQHSALLWPAHAIHHSDTQLTWFTQERMHPIDRLGSLVDTLILGALGFPLWALAANVLIRHYYGSLIHVDAPWTWGRLNLVFNSPAMHRWHHARDIDGSGVNFATVFSVFDRAFGTYHQPGPCDAPLGVREDMGRGALGQYAHPFRVWLGLDKARPAEAAGGDLTRAA